MCCSSEEKTKSAVDRALKRLVQKDYDLLEHDLHERTITHRLAVPLTSECPEWDVDCEYNRRDYDVKRVNQLAAEFFAEGKKSKAHLQTYEDRAVYPDIVVHQRGKGPPANR